MSFRAKYPAVCPLCSQRWDVGTLIIRGGRNKRYRHAVCPCPAGKKVITRNYTWMEWLAAVDKRVTMTSDHHASTDPPNDYFRPGTDTLGEARKLAEYWPAGIALVAGYRDVLISRLGSSLCLPDYTYDVAPGLGIDVSAYVAGSPTPWVVESGHVISPVASHHTLWLIVTGAYSWKLPPEVVEARGGAIAALCDLARIAGRQVRVDVEFHSGVVEKWDTRYTIRLQDYGEHVSLSRLVFQLAHPSALRRLCFAVKEQEDIPTLTNDSYGTSVDAVACPGAIAIPKVNTSDDPRVWQNPFAAQAWIIEKLKQLGIDVREH